LQQTVHIFLMFVFLVAWHHHWL